MVVMLTEAQKKWLVELAKPENKSGLSVVYQRPPPIVMHALKRKGFCRNIYDTFWVITEKGREESKKYGGD